MRAQSIRSFIGAKDYQTSKAFYLQLGFEEHFIEAKMSYFQINDSIGFYLQDYYVKEWINNTMLFVEVPDLDDWLATIQKKLSNSPFKATRLTEIRYESWGQEFMMHDPAGVLWHFGNFQIQS